jgi:hypothetical protein
MRPDKHARETIAMHPCRHASHCSGTCAVRNGVGDAHGHHRRWIVMVVEQLADTIQPREPSAY